MIRHEVFSLPIRTAGASDHIPTVTAYLPDGAGERKPAAVVLGGGGYKVVAQYECEPTARKLAENGFAAFVLHYSCMPAVFPQSLCEALSLIALLREEADRYGIDPARVFVVGFSAGGHLAAACGTLWDREELARYLGENRRRCRPDRMVLCYPVISNEGEHHEDSFVNLLLGGVREEALRRLTCLEHHVSKDTPPTFLWHGEADRIVPVSGSLRFVRRLEEEGVLTECRLYPHADHGGGLCRGQPQEEWFEAALRFLSER